jgi:hypothetical protein
MQRGIGGILAGSVVGALRVTLGLDTAAFQDGLNIAQKRMAATGKNLQAIGGKIASAGAGMSAAISLPFAALVKSSIPAAIESQQALAQVEAAIKSMGPVAGRTTQQLQAQAGALQRISNFDDDDILKSVTANMLTFGNVTGEAFDRAQLAAVNLSARMGTDLQSATLMIGKALNAPVAGLGALSRAGIQFTDQQKEQIKAMVTAGDAAGAQAIMLGELERQFGGAAKAQRDATPDAAMQEQWRTLQENIGAIALRVMPPLLDALTKVADYFNKLSPEMQTFIVGAVAVAAAVGPIAIGIGGITSAIGLFMPALSGLVAFLTVTLIPAAIATAPVWAPIAAAIILAGGAIAALIKYKPQIDAFGEAVVARMRALYEGVKTYLVDKLGAVWKTVTSGIQWIGDKFKWLDDVVVRHSYIPDMVDSIGEHMARLDENMIMPVQDATETAARSFADLASSAVGSLRGIGQSIKSGDWLGAIQGGLNAYSQFSGKGGSVPAFATGGSFQIQGARGIDNNMLALNGKPIARVSHGETVGIGRGGSPTVVQLVVGEGQMFEPRVAGISGNVSVQTISAAQRTGNRRGRQRLA